MIVLNQTGTTITCLELLNKTTGDTPIYLFEITKKDTKIQKKTIIADTSTIPCRCQKFIFTISTSELPLQGQINLLPGEYAYTVYQVNSQSLTANIIKTLTFGILIVQGAISSIYN